MTLVLGASLFWGGFFVGLLTMRNHAMQMIRDGGSKKLKTSELRPGTRWNLRGHDGEIVDVPQGKVVYFSHDVGGDHQVVPVDYFRTVAKKINDEEVA